MNNLYHKVAVASVGIALGFVLGAKEEAYSATFSNFSSPYTQLTFHALDGGSYGNFDGLGDAVDNVSYGNNPEGGYNHSWYMTGRTAVSEQASLLEYSLPFLGLFVNGYRYHENARITSITNAVLSIDVVNWPPFDESLYDSRVLGIFGYVGNGTAEASDLEAGIFLDSTEITEWGSQYASFNVTPFLNRIVNNKNEWAGFGLRSLKKNSILMGREGLYGTRPPILTISGEFEIVEPEPVPEPTIIFGSALGLCLGGWLKRKKSTLQSKSMSQG
jgi:hypothetical protein